MRRESTRVREQVSSCAVTTEAVDLWLTAGDDTNSLYVSGEMRVFALGVVVG